MVDSRDLLESETDFGLRLLLASSSSPTFSSRVLSPLSVAHGIALLHRGFEQGSAARAELETLVPGLAELELAEQHHFVKVTETRGVDVCSANRVFVNQRFQLKQVYLDRIRPLRASAESLNFEEAQKSADVINQFIAQKTDGKIQNLVSPDTLKDAFALLVNAVYFKADWLEKFVKDSTVTRHFYTKHEEGREVPFLNEYETHRDYTEDELFQVLSLPYTDPDFTFVIFLPKLRFGLEPALRRLDGARFQNLLSDLKNSYVNVHIPKMHIEHETPLKDTLEAVGISKVFTEHLSSMADGVKLSSGVHKSVIDVDEEGTRAAAVSVLKARLEMMIMAEPTSFTADHPFLFAVLHHHRPLFLGLHL